MVMDKGGRLRLLSATVVTALLLLVFSGCAAPKNAVSPAPTQSGTQSATQSGTQSATPSAGNTLIAALAPEGTNTTGSGTAHLRMDPEHQEICYMIRVSGIELPATAAHIHRGAMGVNGPIVVPFTAPNAQGVAVGCAHATSDLITTITQHPANYYVNVHNARYPDGAVRGQLSMCSPGSSC